MKKSCLIFMIATATCVAQGQATQPGLGALKDDRLISELAARGLNDLLERALEINQVPEAKRVGIRAIAALREFSESDAKLTTIQRRELLSKISAGIEQAISSLDDPETMMQQASLLIRQGIEPDVNTLEYWGDNDRTQADLKPIVQAVIKLLDRCQTEAARQAEEIGNQLSGPNDPRSRLWEDLNNLANNAAYTRTMLMYDLALCSPAGSDERTETAAQALELLNQFDNPETAVQPAVKNQIGKLHMLRGEFEEAKKSFATVAAAKDLTPAPDAKQQYEARYFSALSDVLSGNELGAREKLTALLSWQETNLPKDQKTQNGADAASAILQYRLAILHANTEIAASEKSKALSQGRELLLALVKRRPDLRAIILEQMLSKLPPDANLTQLDPLLLQAILQRADAERLKPEHDPVDANLLKRGIAAARELLSRRGQAIVDPEAVDAAALLLPLFQERLGKPIEAANGYLDYLKDFTPTPKNATLALDAAQSVIGRLRADSARANSTDVTRVYERFLPIAIAEPFQRKQLAFEYARLLQQQEKFHEAAAIFAQVPRDDPRIASARFYQMVCIRQQLDDQKLQGPARTQVVNEFTLLAQQVHALAEERLSASKSQDDSSRARAILARTALLSADVARREQNDPQRTLELLENIEPQTKGLPGESNLLASALYTRVQAFMALGKTDQATASLVKLLQTRNGGEGVSIVYDLMQRLNHELDQAQAADDKERMAAIARHRAALSGFLVDWARKNPDPKIQQYTYRYSVFDAATKHLAANLEQDQVARVVALKNAMDLYKKLETPEALAMYRATVDPTTGIDPNYPDPQVSLGIGLVAYDLADYAEAQKRLGQLLVDRMLGSPQRTVEENGIERIVDNDEYWEATLKLLQSNLSLAGEHIDATGVEVRKQTQNHLKQLYIQWGDQVGGKKWHQAFEALRLEIIPSFKE
jgi:hypothetical protein